MRASRHGRLRRTLALRAAQATLLGAAVIVGVAAVASTEGAGHTEDAVLVGGTTPTATGAPSAAQPAPAAAVTLADQGLADRPDAAAASRSRRAPAPRTRPRHAGHGLQPRATAPGSYRTTSR